MGFNNRTLDELQKIVAATSYTATTTSTAVEIGSLGAGDEALELIIDTTVKGGTHDSSNYFSIGLEVGATSGGSFFAVDSVLASSDLMDLGTTIIGLNTRQIVNAMSGAETAKFYRIVVTKVSTGATDVTIEVHLQKA
jgi:hypothetical protein